MNVKKSISHWELRDPYAYVLHSWEKIHKIRILHELYPRVVVKFFVLFWALNLPSIFDIDSLKMPLSWRATFILLRLSNR